MPTIQPSSIDDIPELMKLIHSGYRGEESKRGWTTEAHILDGSRISTSTLTKYIESKTGVLLKYSDDEQFPEDEKILGCVYLEKIIKKDEAKCYLGLLTVNPTFQNQGIGKNLLNFAEEWAKSQNCLCLYMTVISCRHELIKWYQKIGFEDTGEKEPFFSDPEFGIPKQQLEFSVLEKRFLQEKD